MEGCGGRDDQEPSNAPNVGAQPFIPDRPPLLCDIADVLLPHCVVEPSAPARMRTCRAGLPMTWAVGLATSHWDLRATARLLAGGSHEPADLHENLAGVVAPELAQNLVAPIGWL